ncbi:MAG: prolyl oligopeptidase family serine peptidase [Lachnospiraceae bacterium]|nr:prolyl oligopeptidase family serine peptidase [Lachnospiraceae bacterium]
MEYHKNKVWKEDPKSADAYRAQYADGIADFIRKTNAKWKEMRSRYFSPEELMKNQKRYRENYKEMLGLSLFSGKSSVPVRKEYVGSDDICRIYRLTVPIVDEIPFYAMLLIPHNAEKPAPIVIAQHGGGGTPELCCDMNGRNNYNHMVQRVLERGAIVVAPQLLLWATTEGETFRAHEIVYNRERMDVDLKRFGSSMTALEISGIMKCLDYVCAMEETEPNKVAMIGLSYGGYFTLYTMAADTRIKAGYCAGAFNDRDIYNRADWCYKHSGQTFQDAEVAALCAPRKLFVQVGKEDKVFDYRSAVREAERVRPYYAVFGMAENFQLSVWSGGHTISDDDTGYEFLFQALS